MKKETNNLVKIATWAKLTSRCFSGVVHLINTGKIKPIDIDGTLFIDTIKYPPFEWLRKK